MFAPLSILLLNLFCRLYQCEFGLNPPFIFTNPQDSPLITTNRILPLDLKKLEDSLDNFTNRSHPLVITKLGAVQGFKMRISESREIFAFNGVPYGETTGGNNRFRPPIPKKPWSRSGTWDATIPSPLCLQTYIFANGQIRGEEDCLHLDIYTPYIPQNKSEKGELLPVFMYIPGGTFFFGDSRTYGPKYLLRENIIFIPINVRMGLFGWLSTGDESAPGNWALKDQALAIEWVHENIEAFGGDPNKIIIGGVSSAAVAAHLMLFTNHRAKNYLKGIVAFSGTAMGGGLDAHDNVKKITDILAESVGCPTSKSIGGNSNRMIKCLREMDPVILINGAKFAQAFTPALFMPTLEPPSESAFISEPPQIQYEKGTVAPIPLIVTRTEDEYQMLSLPLRPFLTGIRPFYSRVISGMLRFVSGTSLSAQVNELEMQRSFEKIYKFYFGKSSPPNFLWGPDYSNFCRLLHDSAITAPMWKSVEYHYRIAPTYTYILKTKVLADLTLFNLIGGERLKQFGAGHGSELPLLFNLSRLAPPLKEGSDYDIVSRRLINMLTNFASIGVPLYRNNEGKLVNVWQPVNDIRNPVALEVGLVNEIKMIVDPVAVSSRLRIWKEVVF